MIKIDEITLNFFYKFLIKINKKLVVFILYQSNYGVMLVKNIIEREIKIVKSNFCLINSIYIKARKRTERARSLVYDLE